MDWDAWCDQDQNDDNLMEVMMIWWGSTPGPRHCCPGQDLQLPALPFPFSCPPLLSPWHQPWLSSLHPSHPCWATNLLTLVQPHLRQAQGCENLGLVALQLQGSRFLAVGGVGRPGPGPHQALLHHLLLQRGAPLIPLGWGPGRRDGAEPFPPALAWSRAPRR